MKYLIFWLCPNDCENDIIIQGRFSMPETFSMFKYHRKISRSPFICISFLIKTMISVFFNLVLKILISDFLLPNSIMVQISRDQKQFFVRSSWNFKRMFQCLFPHQVLHKVLLACEYGSQIELNLSRPRPISYRNHSIDLLCKSMDWFLYDIGLGRERIKYSSVVLCNFST